MDALTRTGLQFNVVSRLNPVAGHNLDEAIEVLRDASVERQILETWLGRWHPVASELKHLLIQLIAHGVRGAKAQSLRVRDPDGTAISASTIVRRLKRAGLPGPGELVRDARLTGVALREQRQVSPAGASVAAGYASLHDRRRAKKRHG